MSILYNLGANLIIHETNKVNGAASLSFTTCDRAVDNICNPDITQPYNLPMMTNE